MKRFVLGFGLSLLLLNLPVSTHAQDSKTVSDDSSAVRATVRDYIEAYYTGDAPRMEQTLDPHYLKQMIHGDIPIRQKTVERPLRPSPSRQDRTDQRARRLRKHRFRQTRHSPLGRLHDAFKVGRSVEDSLGRPANRRLDGHFHTRLQSSSGSVAALVSAMQVALLEGVGIV
jgi:ribosomal protein L21E